MPELPGIVFTCAPLAIMSDAAVWRSEAGHLVVGEVDVIDRHPAVEHYTGDRVRWYPPPVDRRTEQRGQ